MGKEIEKICQQRGHKITHKIDIDDDLAATDFSDVSVAIDFTTPGAVVGNIETLAAKGVNTIVGTTGWYNQMDKVKSIVEKAGTGLLWSGNFSVGVNAFWKMLEKIGPIMNQLPEYDVFGHEFHHNQKKDSPSGTAVKTAEILLNTIDRKDTVVTEKLDRAPAPNELHFSSTRGGAVPGTHSVYFDSSADTIEIRHTARSRSGFALGAVLAAEWLAGKKGFFDMSAFIDDFFKG